MSFQASGDAPNRIGYLVSIAVLLAGFSAIFVLVPIAFVSGVGLLRAGRKGDRRRFANRRVVGPPPMRGPSTSLRPVYAWATLLALGTAVPLAYALLFWITVALSVPY